MVDSTRSMVIVAVLVIVLGIAWLLNTLDVIPGVDWLWTGGLGITGILVIAANGINKFTFVVGLFLVVSSVFSVLRQTGSLRPNIEMPVLFIIFGVLLLLSLVLPLATPKFLREEQESEKR
jgi:hypothetical protein